MEPDWARRCATPAKRFAVRRTGEVWQDRRMSDEDGGRKSPGISMGVSVAIGIAIGAAIGVALDNVATYIGVGAAIGIALGLALRNRGG